MMHKYEIVDATFTSESGNCMAITGCKVDMGTKEVFDIGQNRVNENGRVSIDEVDYPVSKNGCGTEYWYE